jgi:hypothetical protein
MLQESCVLALPSDILSSPDVADQQKIPPDVVVVHDWTAPTRRTCRPASSALLSTHVIAPSAHADGNATLTKKKQPELKSRTVGR